MAPYENWPYSNLHDLNLDWILQVVKEFKDQYQNLTDYFNGLISQLDTKTEEEIIEYNQAVTDALERLDSIEQDIITALTEVRNNYTVYLQTVGNDIAGDLRQTGIDVTASIPSDYTVFYNSALKVSTNGESPNSYQDLNGDFFRTTNRIIACTPNMSMSNGPVAIAAGQYFVTVISVGGAEDQAGISPLQGQNQQYIMLRGIAQATFAMYVRTYGYDTQADAPYFGAWQQII